MILQAIKPSRSRAAATIVCIGFLLILIGAAPVAAQDGAFHATLQENGHERADTLSGDAGFMSLPSMVSTYLQAEEGGCAIHLSGFSKAPSMGTFQVVSDDSLKVRALCILKDREPRERLLAKEGHLTITGRTPERMDATFDFVLEGGVTGKKFRFKGSIASTLKSTI